MAVTTTTTNVFGSDIIVVPLTTVWTAPPGCHSIISEYAYVTSSCAPPGWNSALFNSGDGYYSPGICPSGYTVGCFGTSELNDIKIQPVETAGICVPSNSVCLTDSTGAITSMGYAAIATRTSAAQGWVPIVPIRWQSSDLSILETHPLTPVPWPTATPGTPSLSGSRSSLSLGVIAGIAVAGAVIVLALMLAICFFIRRKRRTAAVSRSYMNTEVNVKGSDQDPTEMDTNAPKQKLVRSELPARRFSTGSHISLPRMYTAGPYQPELEATTITSKLPTSQSNEEGVVSPLVACPAGLYPSELATRSPQIPELPAQQRRQELPAVPEQWPLPPSSHTTNAYPSELAASPVLEIRPLTRASSKASELMRRQVQLQERRQRLAELEWIEQEEEAIQKRLAELS